MRHLMWQVQRDPRPIVSRDDPELRWTGNTAVAHWGTPSYVQVLQGKRPRKMLLDPEADARWLFAHPPRVPLAWFVLNDPNPGPGGWYDSRELLEAVRREYERPPVVPTDPTKPEKMSPDDPKRRLTPKTNW